MTHNADPNSLDFQRKTPVDIAKDNRFQDIISELSPKPTVKTGCSRSSTGDKSRESAMMDQDRIMLVWERFFENAFKSLGNEFLDLDENL